MGPLTFLNGAFLVALAAAALPILIHLFSRRRVREAPFSHLQFLDEITRRRIRRLRLRQWLLLALRTLAVALVALALSQPVWRGAGARSHRGSSAVAILMDDSFSMEAGIDPSLVLPVVGRSGLDLPTRFAAARQRALQVVDLLEEGDRAVLVFLAAPVRVPFESAVRDPALLREELLRAQPRPSRADLPAACERVFPVLASAQTLNREVFVISDFQRNQALEILQRQGAAAQPAGMGTPAAGEGRGALSGNGAATETAAGGGSGASAAPAVLPLPPDTRLYLLPVNTAGVANVALQAALFEPDPAAAGGRALVRARNFGASAIERGLIRVLDGDESGPALAEGFISIEGGGSSQAALPLPRGVSAGGRLVARTAADLLERDNVRYLLALESSRYRVLLVTGGAPDDPDVREELLFALLALDPRDALDPLGRGAELFDARTISADDLGLSTEIDADAVILLNVGRVSAAAAELLASYHKDGGGILIAAGDRVDPRLYNEQVLSRLGGLRLGNIVESLAESEAGDRHFVLRPAAAGHPLFEGFPLSPGEALSSARFRKLLEVHLGPVSRTIAEFSGGHAALVEEPGLLLFTSSLDLRWSDFPTSAAFLPFLHRSLLQLILGGRAGRHEPIVGERLSWPLPAGSGGDGFACPGPGGIEIPVEVSQTDRGPVLLSGPVPEPGFYEIVRRGVPLREFAVNVDTRESDLTAMTPEEGALLFGAEAVRLDADEEISRQVLEARYGRELWPLLLILAFLLLVAETLIARGRAVA